MRKPGTLGTVAIVCLIALLAVERIALGQAGSIGGTIGKTDKSVSGGEEERPGDRKSGHRRATATPATISGKWSWRAKCEDGSAWTGEFNFDQNSDGTFSGNCRVISGPVSCSAVSGRLTGNKATFTVRWPDVLGGHNNPYEFTIAADGQSMQGTEHAPRTGECTYQVKRLSRRTE
jgi:hypothetical protein